MCKRRRAGAGHEHDSTRTQAAVPCMLLQAAPLMCGDNSTAMQRRCITSTGTGRAAIDDSSSAARSPETTHWRML
jgi:hypothetical protein